MQMNYASEELCKWKTMVQEISPNQTEKKNNTRPDDKIF